MANIEPFTPPFFGRVQVANFWVESFPGGGSYFMAIFGLLIVAALVIAFPHARRLESAGAMLARAGELAPGSERVAAFEREIRDYQPEDRE